MFKTLIKIALAVMIIFSFVAPANAVMLDFWAKVYAWDGTMTSKGNAVLTERNTGITFAVVMNNATATLETLYVYNNPRMISLANPVTGTDFADNAKGGDMVAFKVAPSETNELLVDVIVVDQVGGFTAFVKDFSINDHTIVIDERANIEHHGVAFIVTTTSSTETDTGIKFIKPTLISDMLIEVGLAWTSNVEINVGLLESGTNGDADGFIFEEGLPTAGYNSPFRPGVDRTSYFVSTAGEHPCFACGASEISIGTFLGNFGMGTEVTTLTASGKGLFHRESLMIHGTWENSLTYTFPAVAGTLADRPGWGLIHFWFTRIR